MTMELRESGTTTPLLDSSATYGLKNQSNVGVAGRRICKDGGGYISEQAGVGTFSSGGRCFEQGGR